MGSLTSGSGTSISHGPEGVVIGEALRLEVQKDYGWQGLVVGLNIGSCGHFGLQTTTGGTGRAISPIASNISLS